MLAVSTSYGVATAAVLLDGDCLLEQAGDTARRHAETVLPLIDSVLTACGKTLDDLDAFAVDVGPGSFTGVRIGVSVVNALAAVTGKPVIPVDALRTVAQGAELGEERVCAALDARNGNGYCALYEGGIEKRSPDAAVWKEYLSGLPLGTAILGDVDDPACRRVIPTAKLAGMAAFSLTELGAKSVKPLYLRPSQAERMWKIRQEAARHDG